MDGLQDARKLDELRQDVEERKERGLERAVERYTAEQTVEISKGIPATLPSHNENRTEMEPLESGGCRIAGLRRGHGVY